MTVKIGFAMEHPEENQNKSEYITNNEKPAPRKSLVQIRFPGRGIDLTYYNDLFDLKCGDMVYVDGKLEGMLGRVIDVNYNFKIRVSDYKRVVAVVDTDVHGEFYSGNGYFVTFDREAIPSSKAMQWFKAPSNDDDEFVSGNDDTTFRLGDFSGMNISPEIAERGHDYYIENKVKYLSIDGNKGYAIVKGTKIYEVEFEYRNGEIGNLTCPCYCSYNCKHEFAVMLQLKETLEFIENNYADEYERTDYFALINKVTLFEFAIDSNEKGSFVL